MTQNIVFKGDDGRNNPVRLNVDIEGATLNDFTDIQVTLGADTRTLLLNPLNVVVESPTVLALYFYDTTETKANNWIIRAINANNPFGIIITNKCKGNLSLPKLC